MKIIYSNKRHKQRGISLIEVVFYIAILSLVILIVGGAIIWGIRAHGKTQMIAHNIGNATRILDTLSFETRLASSIYTPTTTNNQLSLETIRNTPSGETRTYIDFFLCETRVCIKREGQEPIAISSDDFEITDLSFAQIATDTAPSIQIKITSESINPTGTTGLDDSITLTSTVTLRSYE